MKLPANVLFRKELSLILWRPRGNLDEAVVNEIVAFIDTAKSGPANRSIDSLIVGPRHGRSELKFVFHIALHRRLTSAPQPPVKSAFYVTSPATTHYINSTPC